jgi:hypothetical protein
MKTGIAIPGNELGGLTGLEDAGLFMERHHDSFGTDISWHGERFGAIPSNPWEMGITPTCGSHGKYQKTSGE